MALLLAIKEEDNQNDQYGCSEQKLVQKAHPSGEFVTLVKYCSHALCFLASSPVNIEGREAES